MHPSAVTPALLERQAAFIDYLASAIEERRNAGMPVELSLSVLGDEQRLYRRMVAAAPLDVLEVHVARECFT